MSDSSDQPDSTSRVEGLSTRLSEALTSVGLAVRRREAEIELLDKTLAATGESTSAAARMAREKLARTREEHTEELEIVQRAHAALEQASEDCATLDQDLTGLHGELTDGKKLIEDLRSALQQSETNGADLEGLLAEEKKAREDSEANGKQLEGTIAERDAAIKALEAKLAETESSLSETRDTLEKTQGNLEETQKQLAETEGRLADTETKLADTESKLSDIEKKLADTESRLADTDEKLADTEKTLERTQDDLTNKTREAEELAALMGIMPGVGDSPASEPVAEARADEAKAAKDEEPKAEQTQPDEAKAEEAKADDANGEAKDAGAAEANAEEANADAANEAKAEEAQAAEANGQHAEVPAANGETAKADDSRTDDDEGDGATMAPPGDWGAAVDSPGAKMPPPTEAPAEVPVATEAAGAGGTELFQARRAIEEFQCTDPQEIKLAGALQLQAWGVGELAQLCGLDEGAVKSKLDEYIEAGLVEVTRA